MDPRLLRAIVRQQEQAEQAEQESQSEAQHEAQVKPGSSSALAPAAPVVAAPAAVAAQDAAATKTPSTAAPAFSHSQRSLPSDAKLLRALQAKQEALAEKEAASTRGRGLKVSIEERRAREKLFTAAVRRDIYAVLIGTKGRSQMPVNAKCRARAHTGAPSRLPPEEADSLGLLPLDSVLCERAPGTSETQLWLDPGQRERNELPRFFITRYHDEVPEGYEMLDKSQLLAAIPLLGSLPSGSDPDDSIALTEAFEEFLALELVPFWNENDAASLATPFLCAFNAEMTPRLDIWHRIRSHCLPSQDLRYLLDKGVASRDDLAVFQDLEGEGL